MNPSTTESTRAATPAGATRREFLMSSAATAAAAATGSIITGSLAGCASAPDDRIGAGSGAGERPSPAGAGGKPYDGPIIDTHQHLWDLAALKLPWHGELSGRAKEVLGKTHVLTDYAEATRGTGITRTVYMEVDVADESRRAEAEFLIKTIADGKPAGGPGTPTMAGAVVGGRPLAPGFAEWVAWLRTQKGVKGVRQVMRGKDVLLDDGFLKAVRLLGEADLIWDFCLKPEQLSDAAKVVDLCPGTRFVVDHCGDPFKGDRAAWEKGLAAVAGAKNRNVVCKISGVFADVKAEEWPAAKLAPIVRKCVELFGWDRVIFASDWPVVNVGGSLRVWVDTVKAMFAADTAENQRKLFHDNAVRFYGL